MRTYPPCWVLKAWIQKHRGAIFFFCKRELPSPNISVNHMARILSTSYVHVHVHTRTVNVCAMLHVIISYVILKYAPYDWLKCNPRLQKKKSRPKPLLFHDECPGFFYVHYTTHATYSFTSHPKDEAIMVIVSCSRTQAPRPARPGIDRTHILTTPELESNTPDRSATTLHIVLKIWRHALRLACELPTKVKVENREKYGGVGGGGSGVIHEPRSVTSDLQADPLVAWRSDARYRPRPPLFPRDSTLTLRVMMGVHAQYLQRYLDGISTRAHSAAFIRARASSTTVDIWHNEIPWMVRPEPVYILDRILTGDH